jgi:hypothetical protein
MRGEKFKGLKVVFLKSCLRLHSTDLDLKIVKIFVPIYHCTALITKNVTYPVRVVHVVTDHVLHVVLQPVLLSLVYLSGVSIPQVSLQNICTYTLIKKKIRFSSYTCIRKFRVEQLQSHI